jgi:diacylglycerol kinase (ATP)
VTWRSPADAADGWLDLVTVGAMSRPQLVRLLARARTGGHVGRPGVAIRRVRRVEAAGAGVGPLNVDGEAWGELPASVEVLPGALRWIGA